MVRRKTPELVRDRWIGYRWARHGFAGATSSSAPGSLVGRNRADLLRAGVQDTPAGAARLALELRVARIDGRAVTGALAGDGSLFVSWSLRGAPHAHPVTEGDLVRRAVRPATPEDAAVMLGGWAEQLPVQEPPDSYLRPVVEAMTDIVTGPTTKPELSSMLSDRLPDTLTAWCGRCRSRHVPDPLFRLAGGQAGLALDPESRAPTVLLPAPELPGYRGDDARTDLVASVIRLNGGVSRPVLGGWLAAHSAGLAASLEALDAVPFRLVDENGGHGLVAPAAVIEAVRRSDDAAGVALVGPHDPYLKGVDKTLLVPRQEHRRQLFRPLSPPGAVLVDGEVAGVWRHRRGSGANPRLGVTITPFGSLPKAVRADLDAAARKLLGWAGADEVAVTVES